MATNPKPLTDEQKGKYADFDSMSEYDRLRTQLLAGTAKFTLVSKVTGKRFTYWMRSNAEDKGRNWTTKNQDRTRFWVRLLTGPDNTKDYTYMGFLDGMPDPGKPYFYRHGAKSPIKSNADSALAFSWFAHHFFRNGVMPDGIEVILADECMRCGRTLTVPESIKHHIGPECIGYA